MLLKKLKKILKEDFKGRSFKTNFCDNSKDVKWVYFY